MQLKFAGAAGQYVQGYPRRDIKVEDEAEAKRLIASGCYEAVKVEAKTSKAKKEVQDG